MSDGGEEIGESWVIGSGVLPRKSGLPLEGARCGGSASSGLDARELLLRGGAIVSLKGSGVSDRPSMDGSRPFSGDLKSLPSSSSSLNWPVAGTLSSDWNLLGDGKLGLDLGT